MKNIVLPLAIIALILSACGPSATPTPTSSPTEVPSVTPSPTTTLTPTFTLTPTVTLTPTITPTPYPVLFRDDFEGTIDRYWIWVREDKQMWNLTSNPGWLEILTSPGWIGSEDVKNLLVRKAPNGNFGIETKLKFKPTRNFQIADLLIRQSPGDFIQFGRGFCGNLPCPGDGFYSDLSVNWAADPENFAVSAPATDTVYLRLLREGNNYTAYASEDGTSWMLIGTHTSEMKPIVVGLVVGGDTSAPPQPADFDYFVIFSLP